MELTAVSGMITALEDSLAVNETAIAAASSKMIDSCGMFGSIGEFAGNFTSGVSDMLHSIETAGKKMLDELKPMIESIKSKIAPAKQFLTDVLGRINSMSLELIEKAKSFFGELQSKLTSAMSAISEKITALTNALSEIGNKFVANLRQFKLTKCDVLKANVNVDAIKTGIGDSLKSVTTGVSSALNTATSSVVPSFDLSVPVLA